MIAHQLITVTQKYDTEENNYPTYIPGLKGGQYLLDAIFRACTKTSWKIEAEIIERESFNAALRRK
jgi:hypothetical protein